MKRGLKNNLPITHMEMLVEAMEIDQTAQEESVRTGCWTMANTHTWAAKRLWVSEGAREEVLD